MGSIIATPVAILISLTAIRPSGFVFLSKWIFSYIYIQLSRRSSKNRFDLYDVLADNDPVKLNFIVPDEEIRLESPLDESELYNKSDEVFFYGVNSNSECLVTKIARGCNNEAKAWIYLKLNNGKVYELNEASGFQQSCCEKKVFSCGDLQMHYLSAMRSWRIFFNGLMREIGENSCISSKMVHVKFALIWRASSDVFDFTTDIEAKTVANGFARAKWARFTPPLKKFNEAMNCYAQCGVIMGTLTVESIEEDFNIYLFGERIRCMGETSSVKHVDFSYILGQTFRNGAFLHLSKVSIENVVENLIFGFYVKPSGQMCYLNNKTTEFQIEEDYIEANFLVEDKTFTLRGNSVEEEADLQARSKWNGQARIRHINFEVNSLKCAGILLKGSFIPPHYSTTSKNSLQASKIHTDIPLVVQFCDELCQDSTLTGGKGSSLGKLNELNKERNNFIVPDGIVVTTTAYELFITKDIIEEMKHLENVLYGNKPGDVKEACKRVIDKISNENMPPRIEEAVKNYLQTICPEIETILFAVRSSATGEDTEQMSAAGQMETYLGVAGINEILKAVKKCWASQFSFIAVQYKRHNGQILNSPMAVVIQKMIPCDVAGVLFTCDPLTGNPTKMSITSNYGLGESVVSASEEPDTVELKREYDGKLSIANKIMGAKKQRIILHDDKTGGTNVEEISENERQKFCLTDEMALRLGNLAINIEKSYRSRRDIEWGLWNDNFYIFQSRPVTCGFRENDFEIDHEMDSAMRIENDYFTVCNLGEVMPGAFSTLGLEVVLKYFRINIQKDSYHRALFLPKYFSKGIAKMYSRAMFYCCELLEGMDDSKEMSEAMLISLFGRIIDDEELFTTAKERRSSRKKRFWERIHFTLRLLKRLFSGKRVLDSATKLYSNYRIPVEKYKTPQDVFNALLHSCSDLSQAMQSHMVNSESSSVWNSFLMRILRKERGGMTAEVYSDFARLLTTRGSNVESADVPASLDNLAFYISREKSPEVIKKMDQKEIDEWLKKSETEAGEKYREFLKRHGHRCVKEFDIHSKTWGTDPTNLIQLLKNLVGITSKSVDSKQKENVDKILSDLRLSLGWKARIFLKFLISRSRQAVQNREASKSLLIKSQDAWRKGYYYLAKMMVSEGRIPYEDVLFFMTLNEIKELLSNRSPKIIAKAYHRRKRHPILDGYIFPEIMKGFPKPINMEDRTVISSDEDFSMQGIPVSQGVVKAFVRVALNLEQASYIKPGEILLTYSTDIGWTPYFPILAGVVTELGGLISHGAVVSREYGLPCIAGLHGATRQFQTGDYVLLDGNKGILQRLQKPENLIAL